MKIRIQKTLLILNKHKITEKYKQKNEKLGKNRKWLTSLIYKKVIQNKLESLIRKMRLVKSERKEKICKENMQIHNRTKVPQSTKIGLAERKVGSNEARLNRIIRKKKIVESSNLSL